MKKEIILTADGSYTVCIPEMKVTYHSSHGAISESMHVFIEAGLKHIVSAISSQPIYIFEMGFGTGLNAFLTAIAATELKRKIHYTAIETLPLTFDEVARLKYSEEIGFEALFQRIHASNWEETVEVNECFTLQKIHQSIFNYSTTQVFNLIYYDAFAPSAQPELWLTDVFKKVRNMLAPAGVLVTYCSKGDVRPAMIIAGFKLKRLPGPPHKREMLRAEKDDNIET